jgi:hypothetical protein
MKGRDTNNEKGAANNADALYRKADVKRQLRLCGPMCICDRLKVFSEKGEKC